MERRHFTELPDYNDNRPTFQGFLSEDNDEKSEELSSTCAKAERLQALKECSQPLKPMLVQAKRHKTLELQNLLPHLLAQAKRHKTLELHLLLALKMLELILLPPTLIKGLLLAQAKGLKMLELLPPLRTLTKGPKT